MIGNVFPSGRYIQVSGGTASTYVNGFSGAQGVGNMRYNTTNQRMEVFDGSNWQQLNMGSASIGLNGEAESLLDWARQKRDEEFEMLELAKKSKSVAIALENLNKAKSELELIAILAKEHNEESTS